MSFTVATVNLGNHRVPGLNATMQTRRLGAVVAKLGADVVCCQEARRGLLAPRGFRLLRFPGGQNPIAVRKTLTIRGTGCEWIHAGKPGAWAEKWDTWVTLADWGTIANWHLMSQIDRDGRPRDRQSERYKLATLHIRQARARTLTMDAGKPIIRAGDTNVDLQDDNRERWVLFPAVQLALAGLDDAPIRLGTLGFRTVDRILHNDQLVPTKTALLPARWPFDHDAVAVTFRRLDAVATTVTVLGRAVRVR